MSSTFQTTASPRVLPTERERGSWGMALFIATEAALFLVLFFSYYFLGAHNLQWPMGQPPKLKLVLIMTAVLVSSSFVLHWGERAVRRDRHARARLAVGATILLGLIFLGIQSLEYYNHLKSLKPWDNAYGSIFYAITSFHALHLIMGLLFLGYVLLLPRMEPARTPPHRPLHVASMYWHFVDAVWLVIVTLIYIEPNLRL